MPYIKDRDVIDEKLHPIVQYVAYEADQSKLAGELNYIITRLLKSAYFIPQDAKYVDYNEAIGILECAKLELFRAFVGPYEEKKRQENGDV